MQIIWEYFQRRSERCAARYVFQVKLAEGIIVQNVLLGRPELSQVKG